MAIKYFSKPVFLATLICIFFFYTNKDLVVKKENFSSLVQNDKITFIKGQILSSPVKSSQGKYYVCSFTPQEVETKEGVKSSANGTIQLSIPTELIETYFPGKMFSLSQNKGGSYFESGGHYDFNVKPGKNCFYVTSCTNSYWDSTLSGKISYFRGICRLHFKRLMFSWGDTGGLLLALLTGAREYTNESTKSAFKNAGLSHILALSGMHLSMFSAIALLIGKKIGRKKLSYVLRIICLSIFVWFAGLSPSLMRAFVCAILIIIASMAGVNKPDMTMILCFSFLFQSILCPQDIYNIGFILSYGALGGILLTGRLFYMLYVKLLPTGLSSSLSASTGAQIITAPITLKIFGTFCPIGIIATCVISPLITIFIYSGLLFIILSLFIPVLQGPSGSFLNFQYNIINNLVIFFSQAPIWSVN